MRFSLIKVASIFKFRFMRGASPAAMRFLSWRLGMTIAAKPLIMRLLKDLLATIGLFPEGGSTGSPLTALPTPGFQRKPQ